MRMDLGMRSTSHYDSMPCMTVASLEMSDEPFFILKKAFTPSHGARFRLIFNWLECEGLDFQAFTPWEPLNPHISWFSAVSRCEGLLFQPFTSVHRPCECFKIQTFTPETYENQQEMRSVWRGEYFFREIETVYIRARNEHFLNRMQLFQRDKSASLPKPDTAWSSLHKSPTCPHNSLIRQNKSRTFGKCLSYPQSLILHNLSRIRNFSNLY